MPPYFGVRVFLLLLLLLLLLSLLRVACLLVLLLLLLSVTVKGASEMKCVTTDQFNKEKTKPNKSLFPFT